MADLSKIPAKAKAAIVSLGKTITLHVVNKTLDDQLTGTSADALTLLGTVNSTPLLAPTEKFKDGERPYDCYILLPGDAISDSQDLLDVLVEADSKKWRVYEGTRHLTNDAVAAIELKLSRG